MKSIKVSDKTYARLLKEKAELIKFFEVNFSFDDTINEVIDMLELATANERAEYEKGQQ